MGNENLTRARVIALAMLGAVVVLAGCAGTLPGIGGDAATPTADSSSTATPAATPTPNSTPIPTATPTPTPKATPTATPTPVPDHLDYDWFGDEIAQELNDYRGEEWGEGFSDHEEDIVGVAITKLEGWSVQDAEMDGAREVARMSALVAFDDMEEARETGGFVRPDRFQVLVVDQDGNRLSQTFIDADTAAKYSDGDVTVEEYAEHVADSRVVQEDATEGVTVSEREPIMALRAAEYRPFQQIHLHRIATSNPLNSSASRPEIKKAVTVPEERTLYYEYRAPKDDDIPHTAQVTRTYLETLKKVRESQRTNRLPGQMVLYSDMSWSREESSIVTTAKTKWALEYFALSNWTLPQNKTLTRQELDAYINRINEHQKFIEDDDDYDPLNETVRNSDD